MTNISSQELVLVEQASPHSSLLNPLQTYIIFPLRKNEEGWKRTAVALLSGLGYEAYDLWEVRMPHQPTYWYVVAGPPGSHSRDNQYWVFPGARNGSSAHARDWLNWKKTKPEAAIWRQLRDPFAPTNQTFLLVEIPRSFVGVR